MKEESEINDLGIATWLLSIYLQYEKDRIMLSQDSYIKKVLRRLKMNVSHSVSNYQSLSRSLIYAVIRTRPDLTYTKTLLSQYSSYPNET